VAAILAALGAGLLFGGGTVAALLASGTTDPAVLTLAGAGAALLGGAATYFLVDALNGAREVPVRPAGRIDVAPAEANQRVLGNSNFLERTLESGPNGFSLGDIGTRISTLADLASALAALPGSTVILTENPGETIYDVTLLTTLSGSVPVDVDLDFAGGAIQLSGSQTISADVEIHLVVGVDANSFFIDVNNAFPELAVRNIQTIGAVQGYGRIGFLEVSLSDAALTVDPNVAFTVNLAEPAGPVDNRIRLEDLLAAPAAWSA
jgi:hypothetical protein